MCMVSIVVHESTGDIHGVCLKGCLAMITADNPYGQDPIDFDEETAASRIGSRIRKIRTEKGLSQAELGKMVGLSADRIQKYENGARKPKKDMLKSIASALGVSTLALTDPNTTSYIGAMYAFFELEENFNMKIEETPGDRPPGLCLSVDFQESIYQYMEEWYKAHTAIQAELQAASSQDEKDAIIKAYHDWKWNYPKGIVDRTSKEMQKQRLKSKIEELQEAYDRLSDNYTE